MQHYIKHFGTFRSPEIAKKVYFGQMGTWERDWRTFYPTWERSWEHGNVDGNTERHLVDEHPRPTPLALVPRVEKNPTFSGRCIGFLVLKFKKTQFCE